MANFVRRVAVPRDGQHGWGRLELRVPAYFPTVETPDFLTWAGANQTLDNQR